MNIVFKTTNKISPSDEIYSDWKNLNQGHRASVFTDPDYYMCYLDTYLTKSELLIISAYLENELIAVFPLAKQRMNKFGLFLPTTEIMAGRRSDYWRPTIKQGYEEAVLQQFFKSFLGSKDLSGTLVLPNLPTTHISYEIIKQSLGDNKTQFFEDETVCPWFDFEKTFTEMESKWRKSHKINVRRFRKRLIKNFPDSRFEVIQDKNEAKKLLPIFFETHNHQWLSRGMPASFTDAASKDLLYNFVDRLWDEYVHFSVLYADDTPVSYHFGFVSGGYLLWYKPAFDVSYKKYAPGKIHISMLIERCIEDGLKGMDFIQGSEAYKSDWADTVETTSSFIIRNKALSPAYFWLTKGRPFAESKFENIYYKLNSIFEKSKTSGDSS